MEPPWSRAESASIRLDGLSIEQSVPRGLQGPPQGDETHPLDPSRCRSAASRPRRTSPDRQSLFHEGQTVPPLKALVALGNLYDMESANFSQYVQIKGAAEILGVSPSTVILLKRMGF